ncbi:hypothetical protein MA16_Dca012757 [Dendrobium catenatum]|uniref:Uncharacterized protein n=1 Tax=Dendrobium catenatum TaxID=906689 RepID=A0A2I0V7P1_9ASPA|nr:hypothetical protein MA16_Dca012757 [Dendrobium catenatum]
MKRLLLNHQHTSTRQPIDARVLLDRQMTPELSKEARREGRKGREGRYSSSTTTRFPPGSLPTSEFCPHTVRPVHWTGPAGPHGTGRVAKQATGFAWAEAARTHDPREPFLKDGYVSPLCGVARDDLEDHVDDFHTMYSLNLLCYSVLCLLFVIRTMMMLLSAHPPSWPWLAGNLGSSFSSTDWWALFGMCDDACFICGYHLFALWLGASNG